LFIFVIRLAASPRLALLAIGHGNADNPAVSAALAEAAAKFRSQFAFDKASLAKITDPMAYDYWLANQSKIFAVDGLDVVAMSLYSQAGRGAGGGVIGSPFERLLPAPGKAEFIAPDICTVAFPGGPGVALIGTEKAQAEDFLAFLNRRGQKERSAASILAMAAQTKAEAAIAILDGCGPSEPGGGFYIKRLNIKKTYKLPDSCLNLAGGFSLEVYGVDGAACTGGKRSTAGELLA